MPALFARHNAKRQRLSAEPNLLERANDGFWTPSMGETNAAPVRIINPKHTAVVAEPTVFTIESPTIVTLTPSVMVVTVTSLVEETVPTPTPTFAATLSTEGKLFGGSSSSAIKIINGSDEATTSSALETESSSPSTTDYTTPSPTASAALSESNSGAVSSTDAPLDSSSSTEPSATETERLFGLPSQSQIALVSTSAESIESSASITTAAVPTVAIQSAPPVVSFPSSSASSSEEAIFSLASSRIAVVASSSSEALSASVTLSSIIRAPSALPLATSLPVSSAASGSSSSEKLFSIALSRIAAVSTGAESSSSLAAASSSRRSVSLASSASSVSSASAAASRSAAASIQGGGPPSPTTSSSRSTSTGASTSDDVAGSSGQTSTEQFFRSIGRSPISITITALVSVAILAIILGIVAFFTRRCVRRRRRAAAGHRQLGSEGGSPRLGAGAWGEKDMEEKGGDADSDDETDEEAVWRRRVDRMNAQAAQRYPSLAPAAPLARMRSQLAVAPEMSPISEQMTSSDWTSFIGDGDWGESVDGRSRTGSIDSNASTTEPAILASFSTKGLGPNNSNPHPLRHSWVPSFGSFDSPSLKSLGSPSSQYSPDDEESLVAGLPPTPRSRNFSTTEPASPSTIKEAPHSPSKTNLQHSLDRLVGSAAEYLGGFFSYDGHSKLEEADHYTAFKSPRKAPPTPIVIPPTPRALASPPTFSGPAFPERAATYTAAAPEDTSRPATSRGTNLSFLERSYSDGSQFLGVAHGHVARSVRGKLAVAAGREKPLYSSSKGVTSWSLDEEAAKEACEQDSLLGGAGSSPVQRPQNVDSIDPFDDSHAARAPQSPPSPTTRAETPPPTSASQPLLPFLSPFGNPRSMDFPAANANADEDKDKDSNYWSDETTSTIKRPLSMGSTIRPTPRKERPLAATLVTRRFSTNSASSSSSSDNDDQGKRTSSQLQRSFSDSQIAASTTRPRPVSTASTGTFGSRDSEEDETTSTESGGSDESDSSRTKRERMRRIEEQERTRRLMAERRRRSSGEIIKRV